MKVSVIDELVDMWNVDSVMSDTELDHDSQRAASLHSKYLSILAHHNLHVKMLSVQYKELKLVKWQYFRGELNNPEDLKEHNLPPMTFKILKTDVDIWVDADKELNKLLLKKAFHEEIVGACKEIIKMIHNRQWQIKNTIEHRKFIAGI